VNRSMHSVIVHHQNIRWFANGVLPFRKFGPLDSGNSGTPKDSPEALKPLLRRFLPEQGPDGLATAICLLSPVEAPIPTRLRPVALGNLTIDLRHAEPSGLYWAGRPAVRFAQALHWLRDMLPSDDGQLRRRLVSILPRSRLRASDPRRSARWSPAVPEWMRGIVRDLFHDT
jgi:hypothetical protein